MIGKNFGYWTVLGEGGRDRHNKILLVCECECGNERKVLKENLTQGLSLSCGCRRRRHGMSGTRFHQVWASMKDRCLNEKSARFSRYGGRGIRVCPTWHTFEGFKEDMYDSYLKHADRHGESNTSIDRIDNDKGYSLGNCQWSTALKQSRNRGLFTSNKSGHTGVSWCNTHCKWISYISFEGKQKKLGYFTDLDLAVEARKEAEYKYWNKESIS